MWTVAPAAGNKATLLWWGQPFGELANRTYAEDFAAQLNREGVKVRMGWTAIALPLGGGVVYLDGAEKCRFENYAEAVTVIEYLNTQGFRV